jgi:hypothetical protein
MIHDFLVRSSYWVVLQWYDLLEKGDTLVVLRKKDGVPPPSEGVIAWYAIQPHDRPNPNLTIPRLPRPLKSPALPAI